MRVLHQKMAALFDLAEYLYEEMTAHPDWPRLRSMALAPRGRGARLSPADAHLIARRIERLEERLLGAFTLEQWQQVCEAICPEHYGSQEAAEATRTLPGTLARVEVLEARREAGQTLARKGDVLELPDDLGMKPRAQSDGNGAKNPSTLNGQVVPDGEIISLRGQRRAVLRGEEADG
jgi:hypothetical protein